MNSRTHMRSQRSVVPVALVVLACACADLDSAAPSVQPRPEVPESLAEYQALARESFDGARARRLVSFMDDFVRLPGNTGFDASIQRVMGELEAAGYVNQDQVGEAPLTYRLERRPLRRATWEPVDASLRIVGDEAPLLSIEINRNVVAINSFSTPEGGIEAEVVDVGQGRPADFEGKDLRGKIAFAETRVGVLFAEAVRNHGALGVIAYSIPDFNRPQENRDIISYASVPLDEEHESWGLQLTTNARDRMRQELSRGAVRVHVDIETRIFESVELTLVADVHGASSPDERFVFSGHVQEAGANDNASGVATLSEVARVLAGAVQSGEFVPQRSISMIWGDEISSTRRYLEEDPERAEGVLWGLSLDMVGEDTEKTGGTFLIEKMPDPSAVWTRGEDQHTEWGGRPMTVDELTPHYFNDFILNRCLDQGADNGWVVHTNPYEGGSDHVPFLRADIPGLLLWHFTDVYYHTDGDRLDMVSSETLKNVGVCAAVAAMTLTSADSDVAQFLVGEVERAALERLEAERALSAAAVAAGDDALEQRRIIETWASWYDEALASMSDVEVDGPSAELTARIADARSTVAEAGRDARDALASSSDG